MRNGDSNGDKSVKRWIFNILCGLSLLLCAATVGLWVRSYRLPERFWIIHGPVSWSFATVDGSMHYAWAEAWPEAYHPKAHDPRDAITVQYESGRFFGDFDGYIESEAREVGYQGMGFLICPEDIPYRAAGSTSRRQIFPMWSLFVLTAIGPLMWSVRLARRVWYHRTHLIGHCPCCNYDLRASKDRCPECGTAMPTGIKT